MKTLILAAIRFSLILIVPTATYAISAEWDLDPISGDWNTADNWTPNGVPNGPADIATFGLSNTTDVSISANTEVNSIIFTSAATPNTITVGDGFTLTISGLGIVNNSGLFDHVFLTGSSGQIRFTNSSTAGGGYLVACTTNFFDTSSAGGALFDSNDTTNFFDRSTAGSSSINGGTTNFFDRSTAGNSDISAFSTTNFFDHSSAGSAHFFDEGGPGEYHSLTTPLQATRRYSS